MDMSDDALFYKYPRFVTHVDDRFIRQLTNLYSDHLKPQTQILAAVPFLFVGLFSNFKDSNQSKLITPPTKQIARSLGCR